MPAPVRASRGSRTGSSGSSPRTRRRSTSAWRASRACSPAPAGAARRSPSSPSAAPTARAPASRCSRRMLRAGGYRVGTFTSPHLVDYRERIRLDGAWASEASLIAAFERIADALGGDSLTFFEFNALAALLVFETLVAGRDRARGRPGRAARRGQRRRCRCRGRRVGWPRPHGMARAGPGVDRAREGRDLPARSRRPICGMADPPASADRDGRSRARRARCGCVAAISRPGARRRALGLSRRARACCAACRRRRSPASSQVGNAATALAALRARSTRLPLDRAAIERGLRDGAPARSVPARARSGTASNGCSTSRTIPTPRRRWPRTCARYPVRGRTLAVCGMLG